MDWQGFISQYDLIYETPPICWQDGLILGNGSIGAVFSAPHALEWIINKTDVIDARVHGVRRVIAPNEARRMVAAGADAHEFEQAERGQPAPEGIGPKSCCRLTLDIGMFAGSGNRTSVPAVHSRLSLYDATLRVALDKHLCHPRVESFVHATENLLVIRVRDVSPIVAHTSRIDFSRPEDVELDPPRLTMDQQRVVLHAQMPEGLSYVAAIQVVARESHAFRDNMLLRLREKYRAPALGEVHWRLQGHHGLGLVGGDFDIYVVVVTSRDADNPVAEAHRRLDSAVAQSPQSVHAQHAQAWAQFWRKSWVELGDKALEQLFFHSLYVLRTAYRTAPISGLMGLCYGPSPGPVQITPWTGDLHHDQNVQCPFFPVHALNHGELFDAYIETYESFLPEARRLAQEIWGAPGAHFDMAFNAMGQSILGGVGTYRFFYGGSYIAIMHCLCWNYRRDVKQLREKIYPFLREILEFYLHIMNKGDDGRYHLWPAHTPELDIPQTGDPVQNICMLRMCLRTAIEAAELLRDAGSHVDRWRDLLENLQEYPSHTDESGKRILDATAVPPDHHISQVCGLYPVYPCAEVDALSPPHVLKMYNHTLDVAVRQIALTSYAQEEKFHFQCAWQCFFAAVSLLRLGRSADFWQTYLPMMLRSYSKPNGLMSNNATVIVDPELSEANVKRLPADRTLNDVGQRMPVFEPWCGHDGGSSPDPRAKAFSDPLIEANADYLTLMVEALLQSQNGIIRVFPGWPEDKPAQFYHLVAEGNLLVSAGKRSRGVEFICLERAGSSALTTARILSPWNGEVETWNIPAEGLMLTERGPSPMQAPKPSEPFETARPRIIYQDANGPLWIGRAGAHPHADLNRP